MKIRKKIRVPCTRILTKTRRKEERKTFFSKTKKKRGKKKMLGKVYSRTAQITTEGDRHILFSDGLV